MLRKIILVIGVAVIALGTTLALTLGLMTDGNAQDGDVLVFESASATEIYFGQQLTKDEWRLVSGELEKGHTASVSVTGARTDVGKSLNSFTVAIVDESGKDVTDSYKVETKEGVLEILPRPLTVKANDKSKVFDAAPLATDGYTVTEGTLVPTHKADATYSGSRTEAGSSVGEVKLTVRDASGADVTANYDIEYKSATLSVGKRVLHLRSRSLEAFYDGKYHNDETVIIADGSLPQGCVMKAEFSEGLINASTQDNRFMVSITDISGNDILSSFDIQYVFGRITVLPRAIVVSTADAYKSYDGEELRCEEYDFVSGELAAGDSMEAVFTAGITESGSTANTASFSVVNEKGDRVDANYSITVIHGNLTVARAGLVFISEDAQKKYDGKPLFNHTAGLASGALPAGYGFTYEFMGEITDIGTAENLFKVTIFNGDEQDVTRDFDITYIYGSLTVSKRQIIVASGSDSKVYDGTPLSSDEYTLTGELAEGEELVVEPYATITDAGSIPNEISVKIMRDGEDVTANYDIEAVWGTLTVTKRYLYVVSASGSWIYDGQEHSRCNPDEDLTFVTGSLIDGHSIVVVDFNRTITEVGEIENEFYITVVDADGNDVTMNYAQDREYGMLTVVPMDIVFVSEDIEKIYDAETLYATPGVPQNPDDLGDCTLISEGVGEITDVGQIENDFTVAIINADGEDVSHNFNIIKSVGMLTVLPREIQITSPADTKIYDGEPLTADGYEVISGDTVLGHTLEVTVTGERCDAGQSPNTFEVDILNEYGESVIANYNIVKTEGALIIEKAPLTVASKSVDMTYTGEELSSEEIEIVLGELIDGHELDLNFYVSRTTVGESENEFLCDIIDAEGVSVMHNYDLELIFGVLAVVPRQMIFTTESAAEIYTGDELVCNEYTLENPEIMLEGHTYEVNFADTARITNVGVVSNSIAYVTVLDADGEDVSTNYSFISIEGELVIVPRTITIRTKSAVKEFDGEPLRREEWEIVSLTGLADGHILEVAVSGERTSVGVSDNTIAETRITDADGNVVTSNYEILYQLGELLVIGNPLGSDEESSGGSSEGVDNSGEIGGEQLPDEPILYMYSGKAERVYLRYESFGAYNGRGWDRATPFGKVLPGGYGYNQLVSYALGASGAVSHKVSIRNLAPSQYFLPYYTENEPLNYKVQPNDNVNSSLGPDEYSLYMYSYFGDGTDLVGYLDDEYSDEELEYREFVKGQYLTLPKSTCDELLIILDEAGISADTPDLVEKVVSFVKSSFTYNVLYDESLDSEDDIIVSFLKKYKEGNCTHFASAATALLRALGVPARYTVGLTAKTSAGAYTELGGSNSHAWVEVYVDGVGFIPFEVTPSGATQLQNKESYTVVPEDVSMKYDGTSTLRPSGTVRGIASLLAQGYTYSATVSGERKTVGVSPSIIESFTLVDPFGYDVTDQFNISFATGKIHVYIEELEIVTDSITGTYTGSVYKAPGVELASGALMSGHVFGELYTTGEMTEVGKVANGVHVLIQDANGADVTDYYKIKKSLGTVEVVPRVITLKAASAEKTYDGTALTETAYTTYGQLAGTHVLSVSIVGSQTNVGRSDNVIKSALVLDTDGNDVTANYTIICEKGVLTVTP